MSDTNTPPVQPGKPKTSKAPGIFGIIVLIIAVCWITDMAGCNKPEETEADKAAKAMAGPDNAIVQKIAGLNNGNAYSVGYKDGLMEFANNAQKASQMQGEMQENLQNLNDLKNAFFDAVASQTSENHVNPAVLSEYRRGWNTGWSDHTVH